MTVWIETDLCDGCRRCIKACPYEAVKMQDDKASILSRCTSCGACIAVCRKEAIATDRTPRTIPDFSDHQGVWVFAEQRDGELAGVSLELLGKALRLARTLDQLVSAILPGYGISKLADTLISHGADSVHIVDHPALKQYRTGTYATVMQALTHSYNPNILLIGATHIGRDLAPRVARRIGAGLTADCTALAIDPEEGILLQTRPAFGGNVMATIVSRYSRPQMATVRPGVMERVYDRQHKGRVVHHDLSFEEEEVGTRVLDRVEETGRGVDLTEAKVIVAGGRGVGSAAGFEKLRELARVMGGEVAGTRVTVEEGWIQPENQVGQTGRTVRPDIYIACGSSGAIEHRAGIMNAMYIIAVNKDPRAAIFQVADWGIVGDLHEVVPELIKQMKGLRDSRVRGVKG